MAASVRPSSWIDWYRFARATLGCTYEAAAYANLRCVEDENRRQAQERIRPSRLEPLKSA